MTSDKADVAEKIETQRSFKKKIIPKVPLENNIHGHDLKANQFLQLQNLPCGVIVIIKRHYI